MISQTELSELKSKEELTLLANKLIFELIMPSAAMESINFDSSVASKQIKEGKISQDIAKSVRTVALNSIQTDKKVLKVGYPTFKSLDNLIASQTAAIILDDKCEFSTLKIRRFFPAQKNRLSSAPDFLITLMGKNGSKEWYFVQGNEFKEIINELIVIAQKNNRVNFYASKGMVECYHLLDINYWNNSNWDFSEGTITYYDKINDAMIVESFQSWLEIVKPTLKSTDKLSILSPGAGKGRLDEKLILCLQAMEIPFHYLFIEPSLIQMGLAKKTLQAYHSQNNTISFLNTTLEAAMPILKDKVDCIVLSGGPVNLSIVSPKRARENAIFLQNLLNEDGRLIMTGLTAVIVKPKDLPDLYCQQYAKPFSELVTEELAKDPIVSKAVELSFFGHTQRYVYVKKTQRNEEKAFECPSSVNTLLKI